MENQVLIDYHTYLREHTDKVRFLHSLEKMEKFTKEDFEEIVIRIVNYYIQKDVSDYVSPSVNAEVLKGTIANLKLGMNPFVTPIYSEVVVIRNKRITLTVIERLEAKVAELETDDNDNKLQKIKSDFESILTQSEMSVFMYLIKERSIIGGTQKNISTCFAPISGFSETTLTNSFSKRKVKASIEENPKIILTLKTLFTDLTKSLNDLSK